MISKVEGVGRRVGGVLVMLTNLRASPPSG